MKAKIKFSNEFEKEEYVKQCDSEFESRLDVIMKQVCSLEGLKFLTLSGPTCSGKTTASEKLISECAERGKKTRIISLDDFFRNRKDLEAEAVNGKLDFDSEKALDLECLSEFMKDLQIGKETMLPQFDFNEARRVGYERFSRGDADIIVFEGIQAIYPVFTSMLDADSHECASIYISPLEDLQIGETVIPRREVRLWRRLVRDYRYRSADPEFTFFLWEGVTENEDKNILPYEQNSDYLINSLLGYDAGMLKKELVNILSPIAPSSRYYRKSREILKILEGVDEIDEKYLPKISLYHEFV